MTGELRHLKLVIIVEQQCASYSVFYLYGEARVCCAEVVIVYDSFSLNLMDIYDEYIAQNRFSVKATD